MAERKISPQSLKNLYDSNKEVNQLTKESIETALLLLLEKKEIKSISIAELVRKAGVSRNAFYRNYKSKEEILEAYYEKKTGILKKRWQNLQTKNQKEAVQQRFADFVQQQKDKAEHSKTLSNVSQWIRKKTKGAN